MNTARKGKEKNKINLLAQVSEITAKYMDGVVSRMLFAPHPLVAIIKDWPIKKEPRLVQIRREFIFRFYEFRIWLGEKIAGQKFSDYEDY